ncbi:M60 family metallopeptidase [Chitinibacter tainanensis]|uniref:M60 family metallopeptidase n=1 Tax=Chitinibacter tainanensis TaxID=230667 RepID=UPI002354A86A|nr:M60 family metallopeptidase [Chitinibacter tainanensis]
MQLLPQYGLIAAIALHVVTADAASEWNSSTTYAEAGQVVSYQGQRYTNGWWTKGDNPATSGAWGVWRKVNAAAATPTATPNSTFPPAATPTTTQPSVTATPNATTAPSTVKAWDANTTYANKGQLVSYQGQVYRNEWWTKGDNPAQAGAYGVWRLVGPAQPTNAPSSTPVITPSATPTVKPSATPIATPTVVPTVKPTLAPTATPTVKPTVAPTATPTATPTAAPTATPKPSPTPVSGLIPARSLTLEQPGDIGSLRAAQLRSFNHTPFQSTGYWVQPGDVLVVNYVYSGSAPNKQPEIWLHNIDDDTWNYDTAQKIKLNVGSNTIVSKVKAAVYVAAFNTPTNGELKVELVSGGRVMPRFVLGQHNAEQWQQMLLQYGDAPYAELVSRRMMLTASMGKILRHVDDPVALMTLWDEIVRLEDEQYGIKPGQAWPHNPTPHRFHFVELAPYDGWMYSWQYRMATASDDGAIGTVLNSKKLKTDGWGPWHELGHQYQMSTFTWADQTEVTVNLSSAYVQRGLGQLSRYETQGTWTKTFAYLNQATRDFATQSDLFVRATMFWQLDLAFGRDFYAKLGTNYRNMPAAQRPSGDEAEKQTFIIETSRVAGYDLTPFFTQWGIAVSADTQTKLRGMALKTLTDPIWLNRDSKVLYQPR